jgi:hypothetical protein
MRVCDLAANVIQGNSSFVPTFFAKLHSILLVQNKRASTTAVVKLPISRFQECCTSRTLIMSKVVSILLSIKSTS